MPDVVLIRPGCTDYDEQDRIQGTLDLPLNLHGQAQVREVCERLRHVPIEVIYAAPGEPARSMAEALGAELDVPVRECAGLRNLDQGLWQGLQVDEVRRKYPRVFKQWQESPETICLPEGELVADALARIRKCLQKPLKRKDPFAVVASEPLATLAGCVIRGGGVDHPAPVCGGSKAPLVEFIYANGTPPAGETPEMAATAATSGERSIGSEGPST
ncbi:MAG: histidine phosphatase family protein [Planctomycetales bacterium]